MVPERMGRKIMRLTRITSVGLVALIGVISAAAQDVDKKRPPVHYECPTAGSAPSEPRPRSVSSPPPEWYLDGEFSTSVQVNVDENGNNILGDAANEPSLAVDPTDANIIVIGWRQFDDVNNSFRQSGVGYSHDAGASWTFPGSLWPGRFGSDPVLAADSGGGFYYSAIGFDQPGVRLFRSFDGGVNWDGPRQIFPSFLDKQWHVIDQTGGIGNGHIYMHWTNANNFTRSIDCGLTWEPPFHAPIQNRVWGTLSVAHDGALFMVDRLFAVAISYDAQDPNVSPPTFPDTSQANLGGGIVFQGRVRAVRHL